MEYICNSENKGIISVGLNDSASTSKRGRKIGTSDIDVPKPMKLITLNRCKLPRKSGGEKPNTKKNHTERRSLCSNE